MLVVAVIHDEGNDEGNGDIKHGGGPGLSRISFLTWLDAYQEPFLHPSLRSFLFTLWTVRQYGIEECPWLGGFDVRKR